MKYPPYFLAVIAGFFLLPAIVTASVSITEIMYDPAGAEENGDRDWIELYNEGSDTIFIKGGSANDSWRIYEKNDSTGTENNRTVSASPYQGESLSLTTGEYAVVAKDGARFKQEYPSYAGKIFVASAITLADTGRTMGLRIGSAGEIWGLVSYSKDQGAYDDGNSLQKSGGSFVAALPTPGSAALAASDATAGSDSSSSASSTPPVPSSSSGGGTSWPVEPQVFVNAGPDKATVIGADVAFEAKAWGLENKPLENARYIWNFGDGTVKEGKKTMHVYRYAGDYIVTLDVASGYFAGSDRVKVSVEGSKVLISSLGKGAARYVELKNESSRELDISGWSIKEGAVSFIIPERTFIGGNQKLIFPKEVTGMPAGSDVSLLYPNGSVAARYAPGSSSVAPATAPKTTGNPPPAPIVTEKASVASANVAAAAAADGPEGEGMPSVYKWLGGAILLALAAALGASRLPRAASKSVELSADDFTIIEEKD